MNLYAVFDFKMGQYMQPFPSHNDATAIRNFADEVKRAAPDNFLFQHPGDFTLYAVGSFDQTTGLFSGDGDPRPLINGEGC